MIAEKAASVAGQGLRGLFRGVGALRERSKALHPGGRVGTATLTIHAGAVPVGVPLLDEPGGHTCLVRLSRATGLPEPLPDVLGLALRVESGPEAGCDLLFASTGTGTVGRHVLLPRRAHTDSALTTLLPMRAPTGPLLLALIPTTPDSFELRTAAPGAAWVTRGELRLGEPRDDHPDLRFHPVDRTPSGLTQYDVVRRLRAPSYRDR